VGHDASVLGAAIAKRSSSSCGNALDVDIAVAALGEVGQATISLWQVTFSTRTMDSNFAARLPHPFYGDHVLYHAYNLRYGCHSIAAMGTDWSPACRKANRHSVDRSRSDETALWVRDGYPR
jgi:hypothetical protein